MIFLGYDKMDINEKFSILESKIKEPSFLENKGMANDESYFIFDYDPKEEMIVRKGIEYLKNKINNNLNYGFKIIEFDLYEILIKVLEDDDFLDMVFELETEDGTESLIENIGDALSLHSESNEIVNYIIEHSEEDSILFLTGVGKAYPLIRSHNILNNLNQRLDDVAVIIFYPGTFSGLDLVLFNKLEDNNYYRGKNIVD